MTNKGQRTASVLRHFTTLRRLSFGRLRHGHVSLPGTFGLSSYGKSTSILGAIRNYRSFSRNEKVSFMGGWVVTGFVLKKHRKRKNQCALHALNACTHNHSLHCVLRSRSTVRRAARQVLHGCTDTTLYSVQS